MDPPAETPDENVIMTVDKEWDLHRYDLVLTSLLHDTKFPTNFDISALSDADENQKKLIDFANDRNRLHERIKNGEIQKVKEYTAGKTSKYYFNTENNTAAFTAIANKKFEIYAYLQSINVNLIGNEWDEMENLSNDEKVELRDIMLSHFPSDPKSHILYLRSKLKIISENSENREGYLNKLIDDFEGYLNKLDEIENVSIILKVVQYVENLVLVIDLRNENVQSVCPGASKYDKGLSFLKEKIIYIAAGRPENEILGTISHELTHMAMELIFKNYGDPYDKSDEAKRVKFVGLVELLKENLKEGDGTPWKTLSDSFKKNYEEENAVRSEVIARIPHIIAQFENGQTWLQENVSDLFKFYEGVVQKCKEFVSKESYLIKSKILIRFMNETEGEIINIKKNNLIFFKKINFQIPNEIIFAVTAKYTKIALMRILQKIYSDAYFDFCDKFLVFSLENLIRNLSAVKTVFNSQPAEILFIEWANKANSGKKDIQELIYCANKKSKKIIFVVNEKEKGNFIEIMNWNLLENIDENFSLIDISSKSKILMKNILFQGEEIKLGELINYNDYLYNYINPEMINDLLNDKKIEIGSKPRGMSNLEGAYADVFHELNINSFKGEIRVENNLFIIHINENLSFNSKLEKFFQIYNNITVHYDRERKIYGNKKLIFIPYDMNDDDSFKKFCNLNFDKKIYLINIKEENQIIKFILSKIYNPDFYLERNFIYYEKTIINKSILDTCPLDTIIIYPDDNKLKIDNCKNVQFFKTQDEALNVFNKIKKLNKNVHLLKNEDKKLIWEKSNGSLASLRNSINISNESIKINETEFLDKIKDKKIVILADGPGMGKSTSLIKLCGDDSLIENNWVLRIILKDHFKVIDGINEDELNDQEIFKFLKDIDSTLNNDFCKNLLFTAFDNKLDKKLIIAFDGFDELLNKSHRNKILKLMKYLKDETGCQVWVTTRLHCKEILEDELSTWAIKFLPIDDLARKEFIKKFFEVRSKLLLKESEYSNIFKENAESHDDNSLLEKFANDFIKEAKNIFMKEIEKFIRSPMQLNLLLEDSLESFINWARNVNDEFNFSYLGKNLTEIYEKFFNKKYEIYFNKENILEESNKTTIKESFDKCHEELSKSLILKQKIKIPKIINDKESALLLVGILKLINASESSEKHLEFRHFTFREYFFNQLLIKNLLKTEDHILIDDPVNLFIRTILIKEKFQLIRTFFDEYLKNLKNKNLLLKQDDLSEIKFWEKSKNNEICGFCVAVQENHNQLFDFLFDSIEFNLFEFLMHKTLCNRRIVHLAVRKRNDYALEKLLKEASKLSINKREKLLSNVNANNKTVLHVAVEKKLNSFDKIMEDPEKWPPERLVELLSIRDEEGMTILHYAVKVENESALNLIIEIIKKFESNRVYEYLGVGDTNYIYKFLEIGDNYGETVLHLAVEEKKNEALNKILDEVLKKTKEEENFNFLTISNRFYDSALHLAVSGKNDFAIDKILEFVSKFKTETQVKFVGLIYYKKGTILNFAAKNKYEDENNSPLHKLLEMVSKLDTDKQWEVFQMDNDTGIELFHSIIENGYLKAAVKILGIADEILLNKKILKFIKWKNPDYYFKKLLWPKSLRLAVENNHLEIFELLLTKALDLSSEKEKQKLELFDLIKPRDGTERTNLYAIAIKEGCVKIADLIIKQAEEKLTFGQYDDYVDKVLGPDRLRSAVENGHYKIVELLLPEKLDKASENQKLEIFGLIKEEEGDQRPNICAIAIEKGFAEIASFILDQAKKKLSNQEYSDLLNKLLWPKGLRSAVEKDDYEIIDLLLTKMLEIASEKEKLELFGLLKEKEGIDRLDVICAIAYQNNFNKSTDIILKQAKEKLTPEQYNEFLKETAKYIQA